MTVHLITNSNFSREVARTIPIISSEAGGSLNFLHHSGNALLDQIDRLPQDDVCVVICLHDDARLIDPLQQAAWNRRIALLPAIITRDWLTIGPFISPPASPCWDCWRRRELQHQRGEASGPIAYSAEHLNQCGYLASHVALTAVTILQFLLSPRCTGSGRYLQRRLLSTERKIGRSVGVHGCARCGLAPNAQADPLSRLTVELREAFPAFGEKNRDAL